MKVDENFKLIYFTVSGLSIQIAMLGRFVVGPCWTVGLLYSSRPATYRHSEQASPGWPWPGGTHLRSSRSLPVGQIQRRGRETRYIFGSGRANSGLAGCRAKRFLAWVECWRRACGYLDAGGLLGLQWSDEAWAVVRAQPGWQVSGQQGSGCPLLKVGYRRHVFTLQRVAKIGIRVFIAVKSN